VFGDFDAFQWMMYWGDRPAHGAHCRAHRPQLLRRYPRVKVVLTEMGTVWQPYTLRKGPRLAHGPQGEVGKNVDSTSRRTSSASTWSWRPTRRRTWRGCRRGRHRAHRVRIQLPLGEGLARPADYVGAQLSSFSEPQQQQIMRGNWTRPTDQPVRMRQLG
jgi:hypothetical protein